MSPVVRPTRANRFAALALLVPALALIAGCGGDGGEEDGEDTVSRAAPPASDFPAADGKTLEQVLARWRASPEHNKNMLLPQIRRIGIARVDAPGTRYKRFWALVMAGT